MYRSVLQTSGNVQKKVRKIMYKAGYANVTQKRRRRKTEK